MLVDILCVLFALALAYGVYWLCDIDWDEYRKTNSEG